MAHPVVPGCFDTRGEVKQDYGRLMTDEKPFKLEYTVADL